MSSADRGTVGYATFSNGWVGWLAEAQGRFYITFYQPLPQRTTLPTFASLQLGQTVPEIPKTRRR